MTQPDYRVSASSDRLDYPFEMIRFLGLWTPGVTRWSFVSKFAEFTELLARLVLVVTAPPDPQGAHLFVKMRPLEP